MPISCAEASWSGSSGASVYLDAAQLIVTDTIVIAAGQNIDSTPKTNAGRRRVPLDAYLVSMLREHRKAHLEDRMRGGTGWTDSAHVFTNAVGQAVKPDHVRDRHEKIRMAAGLPALSLHGLRHTCATLLLSTGTPVRDVAELLVHSDPSITLRVYSHTIAGHVDQASD